MSAISAERYLGSKGLLVEKAAAAEEKLAAAVSSSSAAAAKKQKEEAAAAESAAEDDESSFDPTLVRHKGQFALRKLYHESDRVLMVLYSGRDR
jgi:thioredoxin reductase (NADPH)